MTGRVINFPIVKRLPRAPTAAELARSPATVVILPVVPIERWDAETGELIAITPEELAARMSRKRRRLARGRLFLDYRGDA